MCLLYANFFIGVNNPYFDNFSVYLRQDGFNNNIVATVSERHTPPRETPSHVNTQLTNVVCWHDMEECVSPKLLPQFVKIILS